MTVEYRVADALDVFGNEPAASAQFVHLDDAWARPNRNGAFGVTYPTHPVTDEAAASVGEEPEVTTDLTVTELLDTCRRVLAPGGVLAIDTDDYLLSYVLEHVSRTWSQRCYAIAQVTLLTKNGEPDCSTPGMYLSTGGYQTVLAWKDACPVPDGHSLRAHHQLHCCCHRQREDYGWGSVKPLAPYEQWIGAYTSPGDRVLVPCAGTAPAAIAAERRHGADADVLCVDIEPEARGSYERRRRDDLDRQVSLAGWSG